MKKIFFLVFLFSITAVFSQEIYHFDYYTLYDYRTEKNKDVEHQELNFSNSKDNGYILTVIFKKDTINSSMLTDFKNSKIYVYKDTHFTNVNDIKSFQKYTLQPYSLKECIREKRFIYQIDYNDNKSDKTINIKRYNKRKKLLGESFYETKPSEITNNQQYNFPVLAQPLWCEKFELKNDELIAKSYFIEKGKVIHIRTLKEIQKTDFTLNFPVKKSN